MTRSRRDVLGLGLAALVVRPVFASPESMAAAIAGFTAGTEPQEGRIDLQIPPLVENGNSVLMTVAVESPMTPEDHVAEIAVFNELNPLPDVVRFRLTPACGQARVQTRIRLAGSQTIVAIARMRDGSLWRAATAVIVTAPACAEA